MRSVLDASSHLVLALLPPLVIVRAMPTASSSPRTRPHKTLSPRSRPRYNPHSTQPAVQFNLFYPAGPPPLA